MGTYSNPQLLKAKGSWKLWAWGGFIAGIVITAVFVYITSVVLAEPVKSIKETPVYRIIVLLVELALLASLIYKSQKRQIGGLGFLIAFATAISIMVFMELLDFETSKTTERYARQGSIPLAIADMMIPLAIMFLYLHLELIVSETPQLFSVGSR